MTHGSLFSGIGGFDLAADWMGWENVFHCEWNPFGQKVLKHHWPKAISYDDITKTDFSIHRGTIDVLSGGFPCQPYSVAGLRKGKDDERHLWPHMLRAIRESQPRWVVGENVLGIVGWNGGLVFEEVQADLEAEGYEVQPYILPAAAVNAPHRRDRVWFIAYAASSTEGSSREDRKIKSYRSENNDEQGGWRTEGELNNGCGKLLQFTANSNFHNGFLLCRHATCKRGKDSKYCKYCNNGCDGFVAHPNGIGLRGKSDRTRKSRFINKESQTNNWSNFPTQSPICDGDDGVSARLDGITFPKWRNESIKAGGNAIVPQLALQIFRTIDEYEKLPITNRYSANSNRL